MLCFAFKILGALMYKSTVVIALIVSALFAMGVRGDTFFASDGATGNIVKIDDQTGLSTPFSALPSNGLGIAYNPNSNSIYARTFTTLYKVDPTTGSVTTVGPSGSFITGLAFDPAYSTLYSVDQSTGGFYSVNPNTGAATFVGNTGISIPLDLSTDPFSGVLYGGAINGSIYTINTGTGAATLVKPSVTSNLPSAGGLTSISFNAAGDLFGVTIADDRLIKINLSTGTSTYVGPSLPVIDVRGMDFIRTDASPASAAAPLPSIVWGSLMLLGVVAFCRHRQYQTRFFNRSAFSTEGRPIG
jgi:hypothetical protein